MYQYLKSMILVNNQQSNLFPCNNGFRQGENVSPITFPLYLNDLEDYLSSHGCEGVSHTTDNQDHPIDILLFTCFACYMQTILPYYQLLQQTYNTT